MAALPPVAGGMTLRSGRILAASMRMPNAIGTQTYNMDNLPAPLGAKQVSKCIIEFRSIIGPNPINHITMKLEFVQVQRKASPRAPANTTGLTLDFRHVKINGAIGGGRLDIRTCAYSGPHFQANHSINLPIRGRKLTHIPARQVVVGCRDWMTQFIWQLNQGTGRVLNLDITPASHLAIMSDFNFFYAPLPPPGPQIIRTTSGIDKATWNPIYAHVNIGGINYV